MNKLSKAVFTLTFFTLIERVIGFLFKIYLSRELGASTIGAYQVALSFFFVLFALTSSGIPLIIGRQTASYEVTGDKKKGDSLASSGALINLIISICVCIIILIFQDFLNLIMTSDESIYILLIFLPALIFGGVGNAFRGNLWGKEKYFEVSIIELIEQITRIAVCLIMIILGINNLLSASLSLVIATFINAILCYVFYAKNGGKLSRSKGQLKPLIKSSLPITGLKCASALISSIMAVIVPMLFVSSGMSESDALASFGASLSMAFPLMFLPVTVVGALAYTLIPTLSKAVTAGHKNEIKRIAYSAINFSIIVSAIFIPVFYALGESIGEYIFLSAEAGQFLMYGGFLLIPISLENIVSSMMNSLGLEFKGFVNSMIGSGVMFAIMLAFYGNFTIDSLFYSILASLIVSCVLDIVAIKKVTDISYSFIFNIVICAGLTVPCIFVCHWLYVLFDINEFFRLAISSCVGTIMFVILAICMGLIDISAILCHKKKSKREKSLPIKQKGLPNNYIK